METQAEPCGPGPKDTLTFSPRWTVVFIRWLVCAHPSPLLELVCQGGGAF